jgi:hypothetical protein
MAVTEIQSFQSALTRVEILFAGTGKFRLGLDKEIEDYAKIAFFLSQNKQVRKALEEVSKEIWIRYNRPGLMQSPNRFSRAIITYGAEAFGFTTQDNVVFIGALGGPEFLSYVRSGTLWKDTFAPNHGEFAHSFQWFAAGEGLSLGTRTAYLYKKAGEVFSNVPLATRGDNDQLDRSRPQPLWAWLVDCFQPGELDSQIGDADIEHVFSKKTYRVPNLINSDVSTQPKWFISLYVNHRKLWLDKLAERGIQMRKEAGDKDELDSKGRGIMAYQAKAYKAKTDWKAEDATLTSPGGKSIKPSGMVFKKPPGDDTTKGQVEMTFHGSPGWVSMRPTSAKTLIC